MIQNKDNNSTLHIAAYRSKINPTVKPRWTRPQTQYQALTFSSVDKYVYISQNSHRV